MENINLIHLPSLVLENILDHLDATDLKTLRTVSRTTNSYINSPRYLKLMNMCMKPYVKKNEIFLPPDDVARCYNMCLDFRSGYSTKKDLDENLIPFLQKCKPTLNKLEFVATGCLNVLSSVLLNVGQQLESFTYECDTPKIGEDKLRRFREQIVVWNEILKNNMSGLKSFKFKSSGNPLNYYQQSVFVAILTVCPNVVNITLPKLVNRHYPKAQILQPQHHDDSEPFITWIENRMQSNTTKSLTIDFGEMDHQHTWKTTSRTGRNVGLYILAPEGLLRISTLARKLILKNVPSYALPDKQGLRNVDKLNLDTCVRSVVWSHVVWETSNPHADLYIPTKAEIILAINASGLHGYNGPYPHANFAMFEIPSSLNITSLNIHCGERDSVKDPLRLDEIVYRNVFDEVHESVVQLNVVGGGIFKRNTKLATGFPNLKGLHVCGKESGGKSFNTEPFDWFSANGILSGLRGLETVHLHGCVLNIDDVLEYKEDWRKFKKLLSNPKLSSCRIIDGRVCKLESFNSL